MKKFFVILCMFLGGAYTSTAAEYLRWVTWVNKPNHVATASELATMVYAVSIGECKPNTVYELETGTCYKISKPDLWFETILECYQKIDQNVTAENLAVTIKNDDVAIWDNNITHRVNNYYFSSEHNQVRFVGNYSGASVGCRVLVHNGCPVVKMDCGNPLGVILPRPMQQVRPPAPVAVAKAQVQSQCSCPHMYIAPAETLKTSSSDIYVVNSGNTTYQQAERHWWDNVYLNVNFGGQYQQPYPQYRQSYYQPYQPPYYPPQYQPRTMPQGISDGGGIPMWNEGPTNGGGIPATPRGMPGGVN